MRRVPYIVVTLGLIIILALVIHHRNGSEELARPELPPPHLIELTTLLAYNASIAPSISVETGRDVFPGGLMAAMAPAIIDWERSRPEDSEGVAILRNVNDGGNPLAGFTTLRTVAIPLSSLQGAEFVLVPLDPLGKRGFVSHGQIRFLFDENNPVRALGEDGEPDSRIPPITDLIFSWEAWRKPGMDYDVMVGMESDAFALSLRVFTGRQRFLEDALGQRDWYSTPLELPGGRRGLLELLRVSAVMGDGFARHTLVRLLEDERETWLEAGGPLQSGADELVAEWQELRSRIQTGVTADDPRLNPGSDAESYQSLIRSCATMALYTINVAVERLQDAGVDGADQVSTVPMPAIDEVPDWMQEMAHVDLKGLFLRAPHALKYVHANKAVIPTNIPKMLAAAGIGASENGKVVQIQYSLGKRSPYGSAGLIR